MVEIRKACEPDADAISGLMTSLGYPETQSFIRARVSQLISHPDEELLVATRGPAVIGVISLHFIPQLAVSGNFCRISYLCVAETERGNGVGTALESRAAEIAKERGCDRIELHCHARRADAHRFYNRQGYSESPKYLLKSLAGRNSA